MDSDMIASTARVGRFLAVGSISIFASAAFAGGAPRGSGGGLKQDGPAATNVSIRTTRDVTWSDLNLAPFEDKRKQYTYDPFKAMRPGEWQVLREPIIDQTDPVLFSRSIDGRAALDVSLGDCGGADEGCGLVVSFQVSLKDELGHHRNPQSFFMNHAYLRIDDYRPLRLGGMRPQLTIFFTPEHELEWLRPVGGIDVFEFARNYNSAARRRLRTEMYCGHTTLTIGAEGYQPSQFDLKGYQLRPLIKWLNGIRPEHYRCVDKSER